MKKIDFLPDSYREQGAKRQAQIWRLIVVGLFGGAVALTAVFQAGISRQVDAELAQIEAQYLAAQTQSAVITQLRTDLAQAEQAAALHTYLRRPWPRTQLLQALAERLPPGVRFTEISIVPAPLAARPVAKPDEPVADEMTRTVQHFEAASGQQTLVELQGVADDAAELHRYLAALGNHVLIRQVELQSMERGAAPTGDASFTVEVHVAPGLENSTADRAAIAEHTP